MRRLPIILLTVLAVAPLAALAAPAAADAGAVHALELVVDGEAADGIYAVPAGTPKAIVVYGHGQGHTTDSWRHHVAASAARGLVAVAMNYPVCFDLDRSAAESAAAARHFRALYPGLPVIAAGVSMGNAATGPAVADNPGLFDWMVDIEGVTNLVETYVEARAVGHPVARCIEDDTGGTPATAPAAYVQRSVALRPLDLKASGIRGVVIVHDVNDGLVPYNQARELAAALAAVGIPTDMHTVLRGACSNQGTTGTGVFGAPNPACLSGHGSEADGSHVVMATAFELIDALVAGTQVPDGYREFTVDRPGP